jgi:integrase
VEAKGVRSAAAIDWRLKKYIFSHWAARDFPSIRKSDIAALLDHIEDNHGARTADCALTIIRAITNWYANRHDDYTPPVTRGMGRDANTKRARILDDGELRAIWRTADGTFGDIIKLALLTAQRREKIITMRWQDIIDGEWRIPMAQRQKGTGGTLVLPEAAIAWHPIPTSSRVVVPVTSTAPHPASVRAFVGSQAARSTRLDSARTAQNGALADEPRWRPTRHRRTRHGPSNPRRREHLRPA